MKARIRRWGKYLAIRIPKILADKAKLRENSAVKLLVANGKLIVDAIDDPTPTFKELLRHINKENIHGEWMTGPAVGRERL